VSDGLKSCFTVPKEAVAQQIRAQQDIKNIAIEN
jgi:hypothetical protein